MQKFCLAFCRYHSIQCSLMLNCDVYFCDKETEFLEYIDSERLPPLLVDLFEKAQVLLSFLHIYSL